MTTALNGHAIHDKRAEAAVLGACLLERRLPLEVSSVAELRRSDFYSPHHRALWEAMVLVASGGHEVDEVSVLSMLRAEGTLKTAGGASYLAGLATECPAAVDVGRYAQLVTRYAAARRLVDVARDISARGVKLTSHTVDAFLEHSSGEIIRAQEPLRRSASTSRGLWPFETLFGPGQSHEEQRACDYIRTGFQCIDRNTRGFPVGTMSIIAALPSVGKTAFALAAFKNAIEQDVPACFATCEDKASKIAHRLVRQAPASQLRERKAWILDLPKLSPSRLRIHLAPLVKEGLRLVFVDHAQRLRPDRPCASRVLEVESVSNELCALAGDLNVALVLLSQLTRGDWNQRKIPPVGALKWAKALAEDARYIIMLGRMEHVLESKSQGVVDYPHPIYLSVAKNCEGPTIPRDMLIFDPARFGFYPPDLDQRRRGTEVYGTSDPFQPAGSPL